MVTDLLRWGLKLGFYLAFWVFLLSFRWQDKYLFDHAREVLVENPVVETAREEFYTVWSRVSSRVRSSYANMKAEGKEKLPL